jgi:gamma-glutamylcyclotransferase (GGCT)/AIG2-like uncharacterized protein YtfP
LTDFVFFYGTLMSGFRRPGGVRLDRNLALVGRGTVEAKLFDLGEYPAAIRTAGGKVRGEVYRMLDVRSVLRVIDEFEGCRVGSPRESRFSRGRTSTTLLWAAPDASRRATTRVTCGKGVRASRLPPTGAVDACLCS